MIASSNSFFHIIIALSWSDDKGEQKHYLMNLFLQLSLTMPFTGHLSSAVLARRCEQWINQDSFLPLCGRGNPPCGREIYKYLDDVMISSSYSISHLFYQPSSS
jgi:hypothetical protein